MTESYPATTTGRSVPQDQDTSTLPPVKASKPPVWTPDQPITSHDPDAGRNSYGAGGSAGAVTTAGPDTSSPTGPDGTQTSSGGGTSGRSAAKQNRASRQPRKARLTLSHINVYSVFKFSCVLAIALFFVWLILVGVLYGILDVSGALDQVNKAVQTITGDDNTKQVVTGSLVFGAAIIIGAVNIILFIALSTIGSMIYNLCADLVGGVELTLSERE
ncbi:MAG: hypothetical protein JWN95_3777 [Frankiales bacterium]|nr:hypothetical protein [Frankiales bacterium]